MIKAHWVYPQKCEFIGPARVRALIERAWTRAETYGMQSRRGTAALLLCMLMAGHGVDRDLQFHWAARALAGEDGGAPGDRSHRLCDALLAAVPVWWLSD